MTDHTLRVSVVLGRLSDIAGTAKGKRRMRLWGFLIRLAVRFGYVVFLSGPTGCGKTCLLERATPGNVISARDILFRNGFIEPVPFSPQKPVQGITGIDEAEKFELPTLTSSRDLLIKHGVVMTSMNYQGFVDIASALKARKLLLIWLGDRASLQHSKSLAHTHNA